MVQASTLQSVTATRKEDHVRLSRDSNPDETADTF